MGMHELPKNPNLIKMVITDQSKVKIKLCYMHAALYYMHAPYRPRVLIVKSKLNRCKPIKSRILHS